MIGVGPSFAQLPEELKLTAVQVTLHSLPSKIDVGAVKEKDSYEIYSMLLRTEMPPHWNIADWAIRQETQSYPNFGAKDGNNVNECLQLSPGQESIYLPLIKDYVAKNKKKLVLERKFDLPQYALIGPTEVKSIQQRSRAAPSVIFDVSAVGFNQDATRALVYVGHYCGSPCGGGRYHLLVKKDGHWEVDRDRGFSCAWGS